MKLPLRKGLLKDQDGITLIEFAFLLPILVLLFLGMFELTRFMLVHQKLDKTVFTVTDLITQNTIVTNAQVDTILNEASQIMSPLTFSAASDDIIVAAVTVTTAGVTDTVWIRSLSKTVDCDACGGNPPTGPLPAGITARLTPGQVVIVGLVNYRFRSVTTFLEDLAGMPVIGGGSDVEIDNKDVQKVAMMKPRLGALVTPPK